MKVECRVQQHLSSGGGGDSAEVWLWDEMEEKQQGRKKCSDLEANGRKTL